MSGIGIAALVILLLIVAILLIILLTPITYSIDVIGRSPYKGEVKVNWLWRVLSVHFAYMQDRPLFKQVYLLGQQKIGPIRDYDEWLAKRVEEEFQKTVIDDDVEQTASSETYKSKPKKTTTEDTAQEATSHGATTSDTVETDSSSKTTKTDDTSAVEDEKRTFVERVTFTKDGAVKEKIYGTETGSANSIVDDSTAGDDSTSNSEEGEKKFVSEIAKFWWTKHVLNVDLWEQVLLIGKRSYDHSKPRDMFIEGKFGLGNPYRTGLLAALIYTIWPEKADDIELDYRSFHGEGTGYIKGRIILGVLAWYGTKFVLSKPMRELISDVIHVLWVKRKEQKLVEKAIIKKKTNELKKDASVRA